MNEYNSMAFNYEDQGDFKTAAYFYQKVIELAYSCKVHRISFQNKQFELIALLGLGKCFDQEHEKDKAIEILEEAFDNACILEDEEQRLELVKLIGKELIEIYIKKAEEFEKINVDEALRAYENALSTSKRAKETENEARISHKIGELYYQDGNYQKSVHFQEVYIDIIKNTTIEQF